MIKLFLFCVFHLAANFTFGADSWIHVVGIDEQNPQQNQSAFYKSAQDFEDACAEKSAKDCTQFVNLNPKLSVNPEVVPKSLGHNKGATTTKGLSDFIEAKLKESAQSGGSVVISLQNHGAPVAGRGGSCIGLSTTELFCTDDLKPLLQKYPNAKVLISANACYSGGFADLSSPNICAITYADRLHYGLGGTGRSLWNSIVERRAATVSNVAQPLFKEIGSGPLLASQQILQQICAPARKQLGAGKDLSTLSFQVARPILEDPKDCRDADNTPQKAVGLAKEVLNALSQLDSLSCSSIQLPKSVCSARARLSSATSEIRKAFPRLQEIASIQETLPEQFMKYINQFNDPAGGWVKIKKSLSARELKELMDSVALGQEPDWKKYSDVKKAVVKQWWDETQPFSKMMEQKKNLEKESDAIISVLIKKGYYDDMMVLQSCLFQSSEEVSVADKSTADAIKYYDQVAKTIAERKFTENDYEVARKCESSFQF